MVGEPHLTPLEPDIVLIEPQPRHRTPSARMILLHTGWQHNAALGGGHRAYLSVVEDAFAMDVDYARLERFMAQVRSGGSLV
jgi:hypothetical protein